MLDNRAYEQVTPPDKNSSDIDDVVTIGQGRGNFLVWVAADGEAVAYCPAISFGAEPPMVDGVASPTCADYRSFRDSTTWTTEPGTSRTCVIDQDGPESGFWQTRVVSWDKNLDHSVLEAGETSACEISPLDPAAPDHSNNVYRKDVSSDPFSIDLLTPAPAFDPGWAGYSGSGVVGGSDDYSHVFYTSSGKQSADAPVGDFQKLYDWHDGTISLASKDTSGTPITTAFSAVTNADSLNGISADGSRILMASPPPGGFEELSCSSGCDILMREDGTVTYDISESECTSGACPGSSETEAVFRKATEDTSKVWFTSRSRLTNEDTATKGADLYMYTHGPDPVAEPDNLTLLSKDNEPADGTEAKVKAVLGTSADGNTVYFLAHRQLVAGGPIGKDWKVYRWKYNGGSPTLDYIFSILPEDANSFFNGLNLTYEPEKATSDDGKYLRFEGRTQLDPAVDYDKDIDIYRWDEVNGAVCVSCQAAGTPSNGDATTFTDVFRGGPGSQQMSMTADGKRLFFETRDALLPADENGAILDTYEWKDGKLGLISNGQGAVDGRFLGISDDGRDAFFITQERLVGWDYDNNNDIYDARIGGGLPEPPPLQPVCEGEQCRTLGSEQPAPSTAATGVFEGPENKRTLAPCGRGFKRTKVHGKVVCKKKKKHRKRSRKKGHRRAANQTGRAGR